jgi:hypothetical protein
MNFIDEVSGTKILENVIYDHDLQAENSQPPFARFNVSSGSRAKRVWDFGGNTPEALGGAPLGETSAENCPVRPCFSPLGPLSRYSGDWCHLKSRSLNHSIPGVMARSVFSNRMQRWISKLDEATTSSFLAAPLSVRVDGLRADLHPQRDAGSSTVVALRLITRLSG